MKKLFENPEMELTTFTTDDILTVSGGFGTPEDGDIDIEL